MKTAKDFKNPIGWALFRVCYEAGFEYYDPEDLSERFRTLEEGWEWFTGLDQLEHGFRRRVLHFGGTHRWQSFGVHLIIDINEPAEDGLVDYPTHPDFEALVEKAEALWAAENPEQSEVVTTITTEEYDAELERLVSEAGGIYLLRLPGVYDAVVEHFNNEVLQNLRG